MKTLIERLQQVMQEMQWEHADVVRVSGESSSVVSQWLGKGSKEIKSIGKMEAAMRLGQASGYAPLWIAKGSGPEKIINESARHRLPPSAVKEHSDTTFLRAPVIEWARLGVDLYKEKEEIAATEFRPVGPSSSSRAKWYAAEADMPRFRIKRNWLVCIDPIMDESEISDIADNDLCLFKTASGSFVIAEFRRLSEGYEAIPDYGPPLDHIRHGVKAVGLYLGMMR